jgi:hypothetical protein
VDNSSMNKFVSLCVIVLNYARQVIIVNADNCS